MVLVGDDGMLSLHRLRVDCVDHRVWHAAAFARSQLILASPKGGIIVIDVVTDQKVALPSGNVHEPSKGLTRKCMGNSLSVLLQACLHPDVTQVSTSMSS